MAWEDSQGRGSVQASALSPRVNSGPVPSTTSVAAEPVNRPLTQQQPHFSGFDGLRALAAVAVLLTHVGFQTAASYNTAAGPYLARLDSGVSVFFLISGFLLYRPFVVGHLTGRPMLPLAAYAKRRVLRIFPAYWGALFGIALLFGLSIHGMRDWVTFTFLLQIYDKHRYLRGISQAWSLCTELSFYAFLPVYAWGLRRLTAGRAPRAMVKVELAALVALAAVGLAFRVFVDVARPSWGLIGIYWLPCWLDLFALGMALAVVSAGLQSGAVSPSVVEPVDRHPAACWLGAAAVFWIVANRLHLPRGLERLTAKQELARHLGYGAFALLLLLPAAFGGERRGRIRRFLTSRPLVYVGVVSYGIYVWHQAFIEQARRWTGVNVATFGGNPWEVGLLSFAATLAVASISWYLLEAPILRWAHRRTPTRRAAPAPWPDQDPPPSMAADHRRFPCFDGLRAMAAIAIVVHHVAFASGADTSTSAGYVLNHLDVGVSVFFLLSGFLLYRPWAAAHLDGRRGPAVGRYLRRRALRIYPAYWVALTFFVVILRTIHLHNALDWIAYYGLVQIYWRGRALGGIVSTWSLAVEVSFYAFLPFYAAALARLTARATSPAARLRVELVGVAALYASGIGIHTLLLATHAHPTVATLWLPSQIDLFALGMGLAVLSAGASAGLRLPTPAAFAGRHPALCWTLAGVCLLITAFALGLPRTFGSLPKKGEIGRQVFYAATAFFVLLPAVFGPQHQGQLRRLLRSRVAQALGLISYGIFLWHLDWLTRLTAWGVGDWLPGARFASILAVTLAVTIPFAIASYLVIERRLINWHPDARALQPA